MRQKTEIIVLAAVLKENVSGSESVSTVALRRKLRIQNVKGLRTRGTRRPSLTRTGPGVPPVQRKVRPRLMTPTD